MTGEGVMVSTAGAVDGDGDGATGVVCVLILLIVDCCLLIIVSSDQVYIHPPHLHDGPFL